MSKHTINWLRSGSVDGLDWEDEQTITFEFRPGRPEVRTLRNGDPGWPADPDEVEFVSISPGASDDLVRQSLEAEAETWLSSEGYDAAIEIAASDHEDARERAEAARIKRQHDLIRMMDDAAHRAGRAAEERGIDEQRAWYDTSEELK